MPQYLINISPDHVTLQNQLNSSVVSNFQQNIKGDRPIPTISDMNSKTDVKSSVLRQSSKERIDEFSSTTEYSLINADGKKLFCKRWEPVGQKPRAIIFVCHGYAEHLLPYEKLALALVKEGCLVGAHDHVGHGQSDGIRVHVTSVSVYVRDVYQHTDQLKEEYPKLPIFIVGHSMGGTIAIKAGLIKPNYFQGSVLVAPCVQIDPESASPFKIMIARMVGRVYSQFPVAPMEYKYLTRDTNKLAIIKEDPLRHHGYAKAGWSCAMLDALDEIEKSMDSISWPFMIFHGSEDKICNIEGSKMLQEKAVSADKSLKIYKDAFHGLLLELDDVCTEMTKDTISWIKERISNPKKVIKS